VKKNVRTSRSEYISDSKTKKLHQSNKKGLKRYLKSYLSTKTVRDSENDTITESSMKGTARNGKSLFCLLKEVFVNGVNAKRNAVIVAVGLGAMLVFSVVSTATQTVTTPFTTILAEKPVLESYKTLYTTLQNEFNNDINGHQGQCNEFEIRYVNTDDNKQKCSFRDIVAIMSVRYQQKLVYDADGQEMFSTLWHSMNTYTTKTESYDAVYNQSTGQTTSKTKMIIEVEILGLEDVIESLGFDNNQKEWVRQLDKTEFKDIFPEFTYPDPTSSMSIGDVQKMLASIPQSNQTRTDLINVAKSLLGRVSYFWGGKSAAGWNSNWGNLTYVSAAGSKTSGTNQPYGLDCSGFVDWAYKTAGFGNLMNGGTTDQWENSYAIAENELEVGDIVFQGTPANAGINHVGLYIGRDSDGQKQYIHCASGKGVTINGYAGFKYWRRAMVKFKDGRQATIKELPQEPPQADTIPENKDEFVSMIYDRAKANEEKTGVPASVVTAQAILESGYGKSVPTDDEKYSYNLFGIKGEGTNGAVKCTTSEYNKDGKYKIKDSFAAYNNYQDSINKHSEFLKNNER